LTFLYLLVASLLHILLYSIYILESTKIVPGKKKVDIYSNVLYNYNSQQQ